jgi:hypothetical protein
MKPRSFSRLGIVGMALVCLFAVFAGSAFGAGKPEIQQYSVGYTGANYGPNHAELSALVNPNGAATSVTIEYEKRYAVEEWAVAGSMEIGSGSAYVKVTGQALPLLQRQLYRMRARATNSYGTIIRAGTLLELNWNVDNGIGKEPITTSSYTAPGTFTTEWNGSGYSRKLACNQESTGEFGPEAASESLKVTLSGCAYYIGGKLECHPKGSYIVNLGNTFLAKNDISMEFCPGEEGVLSPVRFPNPFSVNGGSDIGEYKTAHVMTMTTQGSVLGSSATMSMSTNWQLTGINVGKKFKLVQSG